MSTFRYSNIMVVNALHLVFEFNKYDKLLSQTFVIE